MPATEDYVRSLAKRSPKQQQASRAEMLDNLLSEANTPDGRNQQHFERGQKLYAPDIEKAMKQGGLQMSILTRMQQQVDNAAAGAAKNPELWEKACGLQEHLHIQAISILDARRFKYESTHKALSEALKKPIDLTAIGGGVVAKQLADAAKLAKSQQWDAALEQLDVAKASLEKVNERAPYVQARRQHADAIKAATGITFKDYGNKIKADWEAAEALAGQGKFQEAADKINEIVGFIKNTVEKDAELATKRKEVDEARAKNLGDMANLLKQDKIDVTALKGLAKKELAGDGFAKQAAQVGDDPGAKTREPIADAVKAEELFKKHDWFKLKEMLHAGKLTKDAMWDLWRFRQKYVSELLDTLRGKYTSLIAKASGSNDLESDIDITFASATSGEDVSAAEEFNKTVKGKFGKPPGRVFDVNIYPRDYSAISESFNPDFNLEAIKDRDIDQPADNLQLLSQVDQDVATLLKQRRFLDEGSFNKMLQDVLAGVPDEKTRKQIEKQFEEGEDIFLLTSQEKIDSIATKLQLNSIKFPKGLDEFYKLRKGGGAKEMAEMQKLTPKVLDLLEETFPDEVMDATDAMYLEKMGQLRADQDRIATLDNWDSPSDAHHPDQDCESVHKGVGHKDWLYNESEALKAKVKKDQFTNIIFANEAYMSQGAIEHVVAGIQSKDAKKKEEALAKLTPATLMQSCNEQLADFFKDMKHYEAEIGGEEDATKKRRDTGEAFVHASKYLVRLLDAAQLLVSKFEKSETPLQFDFITKITKKNPDITTPGKLHARVEEMLYALRKSSTIPVEVKGEVGVAEVDELFGVSDITSFRKLIADLGTEINQKVRTQEEFKKSQEVDKDTERQFFRVPPAPQEFTVAYAYAEGEIEEIEDILSENMPLPEEGKHRDFLVEQFKEALERAEDGHDKLAAINIKKLHEAYQQDTKKLLTTLKSGIARLGKVIEEMQA